MIALLAAAATAAAAPADTPPAGQRATPMAERAVTIAGLNKRNGKAVEITVKPGETITYGPLNIRVRACETAPPWEQKLTGAFLQIDERRGTGARRLYSGWMFAETPSLNPLEHPLYDVWVKSCAMTWPATGPDTIVARGPDPADASNTPRRRSSAKKSAGEASAEAN